MADRDIGFTERARRVLSFAQEEAQRFNHNYIGTEHLLLGLVREGEGLAASVLTNLGVGLNQVRTNVEFIVGRNDRPTTGEVGLTPRARKVIELAAAEARRLNHHFIGTEHLLLGLILEGEGIAVGVLENLGATLEKVRQEVEKILGSPSFDQQTKKTKEELLLALRSQHASLLAALGNLDLTDVDAQSLTTTQILLAQDFLNKIVATIAALDAFNQAR